MSTPKLQTTAIVLLALLLLAIPATLIIRESQTAAPATTDTAATDPDDIDPFAPYTLNPGEPLRFVTASPQIRDLIYHKLTHHRPPAPENPMYMLWHGQHLYWGGIPDKPHQPAKRLLLTLLSYSLNFPAQQMEFTSPLPDTLITIPGDIVVWENPDPAQSFTQLETIFRTQLHLPVKLSFRDVPRKVILFKGQWKLTPHPDAPPADLPLVEFYINAVEKIPDADSTPRGDQKELAISLGSVIKRDLFIEAENPPPQIRYSFNDTLNIESPTPAQSKLLLDHLSQQTNLPWSEETRIVHHLFIEPAP